MFSRIFGKRGKSETAPTPDAPNTRAPVVSHWELAKSAGVDRNPKPVAPAVAKQKVRVPPPVLAEDKGFPADHQIDFVLPTAPAPLNPELSLQQRKEIALQTVEQHHQRISNTIRTLWGYRECSVYINKLIMAGGDGMGHARIGFNQDAVQAMLALSDIHDAEFGAPSTLGAALGL